MQTAFLSFLQVLWAWAGVQHLHWEAVAANHLALWECFCFAFTKHSVLPIVTVLHLTNTALVRKVNCLRSSICVLAQLFRFIMDRLICENVWQWDLLLVLEIHIWSSHMDDYANWPNTHITGQRFTFEIIQSGKKKWIRRLFPPTTFHRMKKLRQGW